ncbi:hypothetical protein [Salibacterium aidingense]|uniref:hypothetical protein n=1 Tax=Salibacterium aidingense TaxID=384933 RepID=UPI000409E455|nr:hypothetical protein [Salibacterium aidingense]
MDVKLSPLSAFHEYKIRWKRLLTTETPVPQGLQINSEKERRALEAIQAVGVIGKSQLFHQYLGRNKKKLKKMENFRLIKRHELVKNNDSIPVYTLGATGLKVLGVPEKGNTWFQMTEWMVLERILFFQLFAKLKDVYEDLEICGTSAPFVGALYSNFHQKHFDILVVRQNEEQIRDQLTQFTSKHPILCICEDLIYLESMNDILKELKIRVTTDYDIKQCSFEEMFYLWYNASWQKQHEVLRHLDNDKAVHGT